MPICNFAQDATHFFPFQLELCLKPFGYLWTGERSPFSNVTHRTCSLELSLHFRVNAVERRRLLGKKLSEELSGSWRAFRCRFYLSLPTIRFGSEIREKFLLNRSLMYKKKCRAKLLIAPTNKLIFAVWAGTWNGSSRVVTPHPELYKNSNVP